MPGTIQATVLEFKSSSSSAESLKVSMGKRHYHTRDTGDFSFPITKLGEDLILVLVDAGGNETARADIRLVQIIEKGCWDKVFSLDGGGGDGQVHMKLQVILSEEERNRIRVMRESAVKKKHETDPTNNLRLTGSTSLTRDVMYLTSSAENVLDSQRKVVVSPKVHVSKAGSSLNSTTSTVKTPNNNRKDDGNLGGNTNPIQVKTESPLTLGWIPDENIKFRLPSALLRSDIMQRAVTMQSETTIPDKKSSVPRKSQDDLAHEPDQNQSRTPSNVRKMISAFEKTQVQGARPIRKSMSVPSHMYRAGNEGLLEVQDSKVGTVPAEQSLMNYEDNFVTGNFHQATNTVTSRPDSVPSKIEQSQTPKESESEVGPNPSRWNSLHNEISRAEPGERMSDETERLPSTLETANRSMDEEQCQAVQANNSAPKQLDSPDSRVTEERDTSVKSSPEEKSFSETEMVQKHDSKQGPKYVTEKDQENLPNRPEPGSSSSPPESSKKLIEQVIKVVVILGFGLLVFLNRQKEPRKKRRFESIDLFTVPDYIEEGTFMDEL